MATYRPGSGLQISFLASHQPLTLIPHRHSNKHRPPFARPKMKFADTHEFQVRCLALRFSRKAA